MFALIEAAGWPVWPLVLASVISLAIIGDVAYHDFEGAATRLDERERIVADVGDKRILFLRNHGLLTTGGNCAEAFIRLFFLERACTMQIKALAGGGELNMPNQGVPDVVAKQSSMMGGGPAKLAWPALMRTLDRIDPSFRN